jgi:hypothetical protein
MAFVADLHDLIGEAAILDAVRRCWASLWTDRAIAYRQRQQLDPATLKLAVVVQEMVLADVAGVLFTRNPVTGAHNEMVVDASPGLGEAVVSGLVTPDHFRLRKHWWGREVVERRLGNREVVVRPLAGGGVDRVSGQAASSPAGMALRRVGARHSGRLRVRKAPTGRRARRAVHQSGVDAALSGSPTATWYVSTALAGWSSARCRPEWHDRPGSSPGSAAVLKMAVAVVRRASA